MDENALAKTILDGIKNGAKVSVPDQMAGAGMRLMDNNEQIGRVDCENLSYVYNAKSAFATYALNGVSLQINSGEFFGVIGHTGSGKSTFVQHLNALLKTPMAEKKYRAKKPKKGKPVPPKTKLIVNGFDLTDKKTDFRALRGKVGMVFQYPEYQLFAETVYEDVAFGLKNFSDKLTKEETDEAVRDALKTVGLSYEEIAKRSPFELSGGQKRRVALAGVIVTKPEILVLDEPAAGLDPLGKEEIMSLLHKIHGEWCKTVIIVSHDMEEIAENCTRAAIFADGKVVSVDTPKGLFEKVSKMQELGLDVPFTARVCKALEKENVKIDCDYTVADFVQKTLVYIKNEGAGTRPTSLKGVADNA
jgi:energy-coupling factor transport system ATP-binding protein